MVQGEQFSVGLFTNVWVKEETILSTYPGPSSFFVFGNFCFIVSKNGVKFIINSQFGGGHIEIWTHI
jgi:hypothetical protein